MPKVENYYLYNTKCDIEIERTLHQYDTVNLLSCIHNTHHYITQYYIPAFKHDNF